MSLTYDESNDTIPLAYDLKNDEIVYYSDVSPDNVQIAIGDFEPLPNLKQGYQFIYCVGCSGSGKSYYAATYAMNYRRLFKKNNIFMFSQKPTDPAFEERVENGKTIDIKNFLKLRRIKIDDDFVDKNIDITHKDFKDCLIIFDDFTAFNNKKITEKICNIVTQVLTMGRCQHIYCVVTAHLFYQVKNKDMYMNIQNEINQLIFFRGVNMFQLYYCLINYWGYTKRQIKNIIDKGRTSRYICINKLPEYIITKNTILLL